MEGTYIGKRKTQVAERKAVYLTLTPEQLAKQMKILEKQMHSHAKNMEFEQAAKVRDELLALKEQLKLG